MFILGLIVGIIIGDIIWALNLAIKTVKECFDEVGKDET